MLPYDEVCRPFRAYYDMICLSNRATPYYCLSCPFRAARANRDSVTVMSEDLYPERVASIIDGCSPSTKELSNKALKGRNRNLLQYLS